MTGWRIIWFSHLRSWRLSYQESPIFANIAATMGAICSYWSPICWYEMPNQWKLSTWSVAIIFLKMTELIELLNLTVFTSFVKISRRVYSRPQVLPRLLLWKAIAIIPGAMAKALFACRMASMGYSLNSYDSFERVYGRTCRSLRVEGLSSSIVIIVRMIKKGLFNEQAGKRMFLLRWDRLSTMFNLWPFRIHDDCKWWRSIFIEDYSQKDDKEIQWYFQAVLWLIWLHWQMLLLLIVWLDAQLFVLLE